MYHMQRRNLRVLLTHQEKERVEKFGEFGDVIPPADLSHRKPGRRIVNGLASVAVVSPPATSKELQAEVLTNNSDLQSSTHAQKDPCTKKRLKQIVIN